MLLYISISVKLTHRNGTHKQKANIMSIIAKIRNNEFEAKEVNGKFYAWIPRAGEWRRVAKTKIVKAA